MAFTAKTDTDPFVAVSGMLELQMLIIRISQTCLDTVDPVSRLSQGSPQVVARLPHVDADDPRFIMNLLPTFLVTIVMTMRARR